MSGKRGVIITEGVEVGISDEFESPIFTYGFLKPHAYHRHRDIMHDIEGFSAQRGAPLHVFYEKDLTMSTEQAAAHYSEHRNRPFFGEIVEMVTCGPTHHFILTGEDAIRSFADIVGATDSRKASPHTLRHKYGEPERGIAYNAIHRSDSIGSLVREVELHFSRDDPNLNDILWKRIDAYKAFLDSLK